ncbi:hypothetical protein ACHAW5_001309 [Stephanodiscus triporus]|uniref:THUMP domain-containing protein n=1 Tax=Stephanodiscus triporus TaxID=2934178 RepID=A0ABD3MFB2_9STRA
MELIHHYYYASRPAMMQKQAQCDDGEKSSTKGATSDVQEEQSLSLEEELAMLRKGAAAEEVLSYEPNLKRPRTALTNATSEHISSMKSPFSVYDTGMRGMVCILCTLPGCEMVPYDDILSGIRGAKEKGAGADAKDKNSESNGHSTTANHDCTESLKEHVSEDHNYPPWDPVETVKCIFRDAKSAGKGSDDTNVNSTNDRGIKNAQRARGEKEPSAPNESLVSTPPGSRFISRMIPMQATCYASVEEIKAVSISLLKRFLPNILSILPKGGKEITYKLEIKRRLCTHLTREQVIDAITPLVKFSVNLSDPDFSIRIETCRTLCGVSILPRQEWYKNFNLAELNNPTSDGK